jgi:REP element-mobilizing transposase RayT
MARPLRRWGHQREDIFLGDVDRQDFLKTLAEACQKTGWQVHAFCLMRNHYHLVLETPSANLVSGMACLKNLSAVSRHKNPFGAQGVQNAFLGRSR